MRYLSSECDHGSSFPLRQLLDTLRKNQCVCCGALHALSLLAPYIGRGTEGEGEGSRTREQTNTILTAFW